MRILLHLSDRNAGWIIEKLARRLKLELQKLGHDVDCSNTISKKYDVVHFMSYAWAEKTSASCTSFSITHIDDKYKLKEIDQKLDVLDIGICFSSHMEKYIKSELRRNNITYILPGHDGIIARRKNTFLITTKIYEDGRKNEHWLYPALKDVFSPEDLNIHIHGSGWDKIVSKLRRDNFEVIYYPGTSNYEADYEIILGDLDIADFYLYFGFDEGSMGTLDAKLAGVRCIVSNQGFHQDICDKTDYLFDDYSSLISNLRKVKLRSQINPVLKSLTWRNYSEAHLKLWCEFLGEGKAPAKSKLASEITEITNQTVDDKIYQNLNTKNNKSFRRLLQYVSRRPIFMNFRK